MSLSRGVIRVACLATLSVAACSDSSTSPSAPSRLAFASVRDGNWNIYSADPDGTNVRQLTADPATDLQPAFSTSRTRIAFYSWREPAGIYVMNADGSDEHLVYAVDPPIGAEQLSWSPDDRRIAYQGARASGDGVAVHVLDVEQGTDRIAREDAESPTWSPDGRWIAFTDASFYEIWVMPPSGFNPRLILTNGIEPALSPDGQRLAFASWRDGTLRIYTARSSDGAGVTRVTNAVEGEDRGPAWSPDGRRIAFTRDAFPTSDVWTIAADGTDERRVTNGPATNGGVTW